jgi:hypothetical protein
LYSFGTFFPVWVSCAKKNLATLDQIGPTFKCYYIPKYALCVNFDKNGLG